MLGNTTASHLGFSGFSPSVIPTPGLERINFSAPASFFYPADAHIYYPPASLGLYAYSFPYQEQFLLNNPETRLSVNTVKYASVPAYPPYQTAAHIYYPPAQMEHYVYPGPYQAQALPHDPEASLITAYQKNDVNTIKSLLQTNTFHLNNLPIAYENATDETKSDPLLLNACRQGKTEIMDMLIEAGANINIGNFVGESLLLLTYQGIVEKSARYQRIQSLLERGADPNVNAPNNDWQPLLVLAWRENRRDIVELLLQYKTDPNVYDQVYPEKRTLQPLLMVAYRVGDQEMVDLLLRYGADKDACEYDEYAHPGLSFNDLLNQNN